MADLSFELSYVREKFEFNDLNALIQVACLLASANLFFFKSSISIPI